MKKGISPLIATVLLIGFAIIIAVLFMSWVRGVFNEGENVQDYLVKAEIKCTQINYNIRTVTNSDTLDLFIQNNGEETIDSFWVRGFDGDNLITQYENGDLIISPDDLDIFLNSFAEESYTIDFDDDNQAEETEIIEVIAIVKFRDNQNKEHQISCENSKITNVNWS